MKTIPLTHGKVAIVDDADYEMLVEIGKKNAWIAVRRSPSKSWYAVKGGGSKRGAPKTYAQMHRLIMNAPNGIQVDHINHNGLDNRRCNLRLATSRQNHYNSKSRPNKTGYRGVQIMRQCNPPRFQAKIKYGGKTKCLGMFVTAEAAHAAYVAAAKELHGEFFYSEARAVTEGK